MLKIKNITKKLFNGGYNNNNNLGLSTMTTLSKPFNIVPTSTMEFQDNSMMKPVYKGPLTKEEIEHFNENGYVVVKSKLIDDRLLTNHQIEVREYLKNNASIDFGNTTIGSIQESELLWKQELKMGNVSNGFGGMVNFYHGKYEYKIREDKNLYDSFVQLFQSTYSTTPITKDDLDLSYNDENEWPNEYGEFDPQHMFMFVNRCGFRIPTIIEDSNGNGNSNCNSNNNNKVIEQQIKLQKGTGLHLDCNPFHLFRGEHLNKDKQIEHIPLRFWQPIQAFISCTDTPKPGQGGFWTIPKFHKKCVKYFNQHKSQLQQQQQSSSSSDHQIPTPIPTEILKRGNAYDFQDGQHLDIIDQLKYIPIERGDVLFWDWRMPHCNDTIHIGPSIREVVYAAHLPMVPINIQYAEAQKIWYQTGKHPSYVAKKFSNLETVNYSPPHLSDLGKIGRAHV